MGEHVHSYDATMRMAKAILGDSFALTYNVQEAQAKMVIRQLVEEAEGLKKAVAIQQTRADDMGQFIQRLQAKLRKRRAEVARLNTELEDLRVDRFRLGAAVTRHDYLDVMAHDEALDLLEQARPWVLPTLMHDEGCPCMRCDVAKKMLTYLLNDG